MGSAAHEVVIVREGLEPGSFPHREATHLLRVRVDVVVPIFRDVRDDGRGRRVPKLHAEAVQKWRVISPDVLVGGL